MITTDSPIASILMAAGRGSRMKDYAGNKTLLPLSPAKSIYEGAHPILVHILDRLPAGPKAVVVNHCKADVIQATRHLDVSYCEQPRLNGTGGAILAAGEFIHHQSAAYLIITMGDVPFVAAATYRRLVRELAENDMVVLGFTPKDKKKYGVLEIEGGQVRRITEWKYWKDYPEARQAALRVCNAGIYAAKTEHLRTYLPIMASRPQVVQKEVDGRMTAIEEFFITDMIEYMVADGRSVGYLTVEDEIETMGIDDPEALRKAQAYFSEDK